MLGSARQDFYFIGVPSPAQTIPLWVTTLHQEKLAIFAIHKITGDLKQLLARPKGQGGYSSRARHLVVNDKCLHTLLCLSIKDGDL